MGLGKGWGQGSGDVLCLSKSPQRYKYEDVCVCVCTQTSNGSKCRTSLNFPCFCLSISHAAVSVRLCVTPGETFPERYIMNGAAVFTALPCESHGSADKSLTFLSQPPLSGRSAASVKTANYRPSEKVYEPVQEAATSSEYGLCHRCHSE